MSAITCRSCLAYDVRMYSIINSPLQLIYERLTNVPFKTEDDRPKTVCYICCYQLKKCQKFMQKSLKSDEMFTQLLSTGVELNRGTLDVIKKQSRYGSWCLQMTPIEYVLCQETKVRDEVEVKVEEVKIEEDTFDQPEHREEDNPTPLLDLPEHDSSDSEDDIPLRNISTRSNVGVAKKEDIPEASSILANGIDSNISQEKSQNEPIIERKADAEYNNFVKKYKKVIHSNVDTQKDNVDVQKNKSSIFKSSATDNINNFSLQSSKPKDCNNKSKYTVHTTDVTFNSFICDMCERKFNSKRNLEIHIKEHYEQNSHHTSKIFVSIGNKERPFKCNVCYKAFTASSALSRHYLIHTKEKPFKCDICNKEFNQGGTLKIHYRIHTKERPYKCDVCRKAFPDSYHLKRHYRIHTKEMPYKCDVCCKAFPDSNQLKRHYRIHTKDKQFKCNVCYKTFTESSSLSNHCRIHSKEKPYVCDICNKEFNQYGNLKRHYLIHTEEKPHKCNVCYKAFSYRYHLKRHHSVHTKEKPYICKKCNKRFALNETLKNHYRTHTKEKPYECEICHKKFAYNHHLRAHYRTHTKEKPYKCDVCSKTFSGRSNFKTHFRIHTNEKPYECDICKKRFNRSCHLKRHYSVHS